MSALIAVSLFSSCGNDDNNVDETPASSTNNVTSANYKDVKLATREINSVVQSAMSGSSGNKKKTSNECTTITSEFNETSATVTIDYGTNCTINEKAISGKIIVNYSIKEGTPELAFNMSYTLENFSYNDITVSGTSTGTFKLDNLTMGDGTRFETKTDFVFTWKDGLTATSKGNTSITGVINMEQPKESYSFIILDNEISFSTGEYITSKSSPLRIENGCSYIVSGTVVTTENKIHTTLDYGDGACDNIAILKDKEGNETTIDLDVEVADNYSL